jgi:hypothetical protein
MEHQIEPRFDLRSPVIGEVTGEQPGLLEQTPHACMDGWVFLGFEGEDENGEHIEEIERVPCRRCNHDVVADERSLA